MFTMASAREARPRYDEQYKQLFAFPRMVEDLLRAFVAIYSATSPRNSEDQVLVFIPTWRIETWLAYLG